MKKQLVTIFALALALAFTGGCAGISVGVSQADGVQIEVIGAYPRSWRAVSWDNNQGKSFDLLYFDSAPNDGNPAGVVLEDPEDDE